MTTATDQLDQRIRDHLRANRDYPPTVGEIYDALGIPASSIRASLRRLSIAGEAKQAGIGTNNGRTWVLVDATGDTE